MTACTIPAHRIRRMIVILSEEAVAGTVMQSRLLLVRDWLLEAAVTDVAIEREDERAIERAGIA